MKNKNLLIVLLITCLGLLTACELRINESKPLQYLKEIETITNEENINQLDNIVEETTEEDKYTEVKVSSVKDIFQNVKPYTRIILTEEYYNTSNVDPSKFKGEYAYLENTFDGYEFIIHDVNNFEICSSNDVLAEIVTEAPHVNVISLKNCNNVKISGIVAGHEVEKGYCSGAVVNLDDSSNIEISNCRLYGSGTYGITTTECSNVKVNDTQIYECTYGLVNLSNSNNFEFNNCILRDSEMYDMFSIVECNDIKFNNCTITGNKCVDSCSLIGTYLSTNISFVKCLFEKNTYDTFGDVEDFECVNCIGRDENYGVPYYVDIEPNNG